MLMMALLPPGGLLGGYAGDPDGISGSWEKACTSVSTPIRVRVALATGVSGRCRVLIFSGSFMLGSSSDDEDARGDGDSTRGGGRYVPPHKKHRGRVDARASTGRLQRPDCG